MAKHVGLGVCLRAEAAPLQRPFTSSFFWILAAAIIVIGLIAPAVWAQNIVKTIAGGGPNNLPALKSSMDSPATVAIDGAGNVYVAAFNSGRVFRVASNGNVTVVAGIRRAVRLFAEMAAQPSAPRLRNPAA